MDEKEHDISSSGGESNEPLLVLRYEPWRILWKLFFPY